MATVIRLSPRILAVGASATVSWTPAAEPVVVAMQTQQQGTAWCTTRMIVRDATGKTRGSMVIAGSDTQRIEVEGFDGDCTLDVCCLEGTVAIAVADLTGAAALGSLVATADCTVPLLTANAAGRALMADDLFRADEFAAGAGGKFAANCLVAAGIQNLFADDAFTAVEFAAGAGGKFAANCLVNAGLANLIADDAFTAAEFAAGAGGKFAANCLVSAGIQNLFAANSFDGAACAAVIANGAIPIAKVAAAPLAIETVIADPGNGADIVVTGSGHCNLNILGGGHNRGLPIPTIDGQAILIVHTAGANAGTVTSAQALDPRGTTVINFTAELGQWILLIGRNNGAALRWQVVAQGGGVTTSTPVYGPLAIPDLGVGAIPVTTNGRYAFTIGAPADDRTLAAPTWEGQTIVLESLAGSAAGTVTIATGYTQGGATIIRFLGGVNEQIVLVANLIAGVLRWRVLKDDEMTHVSRTLIDPGNTGAIEVLHDHGFCQIDILGAGHDRTLAIPTFAGQTLTIAHIAGANAGTVTCAQDITDVGGQNRINFTAALGEMIVLEGVNFGVGLRWRIRSNPDGLVID